MSIIQQNSRVSLHRITGTGSTPTIPASNDFTDNTWIASDLMEGEIMFNMTDDKAWFRSDNGIVQLATVATSSATQSDCCSPLYTSVMQKDVFNTTTETSLFDTGIGSLTILPDTLKVGDTLVLDMAGYYLTNNGPTATGTFSLRLKDNGSTIDTCTQQLLNLNAQVLPFNIHVSITIQATGSFGVGSFFTNTSFDAPVVGFGNLPLKNQFGNPLFHSKVFNTSATHSFDITAQFAIANPANLIVQTEATLKKYSA